MKRGLTSPCPQGAHRIRQAADPKLACKRTKENPRIGGFKHQRLIKGHAGNMREITQLCCHSSPPLLIVAARIQMPQPPRRVV